MKNRPPIQGKKFADILSRFRNDVMEFSEKYGGVQKTDKNFKPQISRKEKRKMERKLKHAKKLAFSRKEKAPTLDDIIVSESKGKKSKKLVKPLVEKSIEIEKPIEKPVKKEVIKEENLNTIQKIENRVKKEKKEKQKYLDSYQHTLKEKLVKDNEEDEKEIRKLEKLLHIKKDSKKYKQVFYDEGFSDLLDFCDEEKRQEMIKNEMNAWLSEKDVNPDESVAKKQKREKIDELNKRLNDDESDNSDQSEIETDEEEEGSDDDEKQNDFFIQSNSKQAKKKVKFSKAEEELEESDESGSPLVSDEDRTPLGSDNEDNEEINNDEQDDDESNFSNEESNEEDESANENLSEEEMSQDSEDDDLISSKKSKKEPELKEDIYGRLVDKQGNVIKTEKYIPPAQRLKNLIENSSNENSIKLQRLQKQINGLFNRLSTSNIISILNQIVQLVYSNQYTRYDIMETIYNLIDSSLIKSACMTPIRLIIEHAALLSALTTSVGVELGANLLQRLCQKLNQNIQDLTFYNLENKTFDNLILFLCNLYHFKLFSSNLLVDLLNDNLIESITNDEKLEKLVDLVLIILKSVGFSLRKDAPIELKDLIIKLQSKINALKSSTNSSDEINNRLKFMLESINAIKNNDIRRLDSYDQAPIDLIKKQMKNSFKEDQILLNITYKDLINVEQRGRWWIVGSAWNNREENEVKKDVKKEKITTEGVYSEKILQLAKEQRMNTDIRKSIFCIIVSAEDYTDAFIKLVKLSLKKQQEREIVYVIVHCALNEKKYNPYYSYLMQKFCEYDRRFKMTLQFHTWDKFKLLSEMTKQQINNFALMYAHLISNSAMTLSVLKNVEFGEMNKCLLQFLKEFFENLFNKNNHEKIQEIFLKISTIKKLYQLRNALKLFFCHFMLTDKGKTIELDEKLKEKIEFTEKILNLNSD